MERTEEGWGRGGIESRRGLALGNCIWARRSDVDGAKTRREGEKREGCMCLCALEEFGTWSGRDRKSLVVGMGMDGGVDELSVVQGHGRCGREGGWEWWM